MGNICRSTTAEVIMQHLVESRGLEKDVLIEGAGTTDWDQGQLADARSRKTAQLHGLEISSRAKYFEVQDFSRFDYIVAIDRSNQKNLLQRCPDKYKKKINLLRDFDEQANGDLDVPDPYYGAGDGFEVVFDICKRSCKRFFEFLVEKHSLSS